MPGARYFNIRTQSLIQLLADKQGSKTFRSDMCFIEKSLFRVSVENWLFPDINYYNFAWLSISRWKLAKIDFKQSIIQNKVKKD